MKKKIILFLVLLLLFSILFIDHSYLQEEEKKQGECLAFINGNKYLELSEIYRIDYILGLVDMWWYLHNFHYSEIYQIIKEEMEDMTGEQVKKIFEKYLEEHPEKLHYSAAYLFEEAIFGALMD